jgi:DNA-binding CsgD family transcriptional regulator
VPPASGSLAIQAPGGYGKSTILRSWRVHASLTLVDDAHLLDAERLTELRKLVESRETQVVVAYRPWPRSAALAELIEALKRDAAPMLLEPWSQAQTAAYLQPDALARFVFEQARGVPRYIARLASALSEHGFSGEVPPSAVLQFAPDFEELSPGLWRLLLAIAAGATVSTTVLCPLLGLDPHQLDDLLAAARATGLLCPDGVLPPIARQAIVALSPPSHRDSVWKHLVHMRLAQGAPILPVMRSMRAGGYPAEALEAAAEEALPVDPAFAAELFAAAVAAGRQATGRQAKAAALSGDLTYAMRFADRLVSAQESPDRADGVAAVATALAHRGHLDRSAEVLRWSGAASFAAIAAAATGHPEHLDVAPSDTPPTLLASAARLMARGVRETLVGSPTSALSAFIQAGALLEPAGATTLLPDSPAALAALTGIHSSELNIAESVLDRAIAAGLGAALLAPRHRLLRAWVLMSRGQTTVAKQEAAKVARLEPRDALFAIGLEVGIARRDGDMPALQQGWAKAPEALLRHPVDLFTLLPLGELAIATAKLNESARVAVYLDEATDLLRQLGDPPLWTVHFHWHLLHAAILSEDHSALDRHLGVIQTLGHGSLLAPAAECWVDLLRGRVDPEKVADTAQRLHTAGLSWDGARLAGQAAIRTPDRRAMTALLDCARMIQGKQPGRPETSQLSDREQEVAGLVLSGLTYKQIGDHLFISAKTVEHHVARMRQRLNCTSRAELLTRLRAMETSQPPVRVPRQRQS